MPLEQALRALPPTNAAQTLELIDKLTQNVKKNPSEDKFRHIKLSNPKIAAAITNVPGAVDALKEMGWKESPDGLALPTSVSFDLGIEILAIAEAKEHYIKLAQAGPDKKGNSTAKVEDSDKDVIEYKDNDGEHVRLVKHISDEQADVHGAHVEVFVEGNSFWRGIPTFSAMTGTLTCGSKGASQVPEADRDRMGQYIATLP
eukprot:gnl/MRDRNA2_/MRDRNA2_100266_c0_seq1.p1 gnl/MRDRNA2_/MRDRNA2_100266_c0~~gnl/MRDRNA2_/MRDRNA2_100266_c0_seq1.p1  ORF type:complete len:220 (-),score=40.46 gnl/MRDRNA2_/MRDRNA2_100266_c0_seq1:30-635(-)